jgi:hypothetical protein
MKQPNDHIRAEELFSAYIDQHVTADERTFVERHVAVCADCRARLEAMQAMVKAMRAMPVVKAPRSFVLPREMARQPQPSIFGWYRTLRVATAIAAAAFVVVFAGDLLNSQIGFANVTASAPPSATLQMNPAEAPTAAPLPLAAAQPTAGAAGGQAATAEAPAAAPLLPTATTEALQADASSRSMLTATVTNTESLAVAEAPTSVAPQTKMPLANQSAEETQPVEVVPPSIDPLRPIEIGLAGLAITLGLATLIVRRRAA